MTLKLKERRILPVINRMREKILDSEKDIGVLIQTEFFSDIVKEYSQEETTYAIRYLLGKGYFDYYGIGRYEGTDIKLTSKGYEEWIFPNGQTDPRSIFISYATDDKELAGKIKKELEKYNLKIFLAHEDIEPTAKWRDKIISDLKSCNIFISLRTDNYIGKQYTEQECGFALALNKRILSLCIGTTSEKMGFCSEFQGEKFNIEDGIEYKIIDFLIKQLSAIIE